MKAREVVLKGEVRGYCAKCKDRKAAKDLALLWGRVICRAGTGCRAEKK